MLLDDLPVLQPPVMWSVVRGPTDLNIQPADISATRTSVEFLLKAPKTFGLALHDTLYIPTMLRNILLIMSQCYLYEYKAERDLKAKLTQQSDRLPSL